MIDIEVVRNILEQLKAFGQERVSLSDLAVYSHYNYQQVKQDLAVLNRYFNVSKSGRSIYISLKG